MGLFLAIPSLKIILPVFGGLVGTAGITSCSFCDFSSRNKGVKGNLSVHKDSTPKFSSELGAFREPFFYSAPIPSYALYERFLELPKYRSPFHYERSPLDLECYPIGWGDYHCSRRSYPFLYSRRLIRPSREDIRDSFEAFYSGPQEQKTKELKHTKSPRPSFDKGNRTLESSHSSPNKRACERAYQYVDGKYINYQTDESCVDQTTAVSFI
ncbi:hypothetical protein MHLP_00390 [Candidatus Mycoplasma haematolamae str. Purdue]|uniref:Uncharacterized protein n=1 Tax=Mycoplasma haematolamae (strain Purdue) TaxID=1212765 RepID=I7BIL0_MYCHA|nr:hypothetical protein [Candidatus Mycoplasma haematolamae]AFO51658.1 hypothetical protein MHLP_00390 [Candidatus Mycoplasma haematolamae str. Purdue]